MLDEFSLYQQGIRHLLAYLTSSSQSKELINEIELHEIKLDIQIKRVRLVGDKSERPEIYETISRLNEVSKDITGKRLIEWHDTKPIEHNGQTSILVPSQTSETSPNKLQFEPPVDQEQMSEMLPLILPLPIQKYVQEILLSFQTMLPLFEKEGVIYPSQVISLRQSLQQINRGISSEIIGAIEPSTLGQASLVITINRIRYCTEEIIDRLARFEATCRKPTGRAQQQSIREDHFLDTRASCSHFGKSIVVKRVFGYTQPSLTKALTVGYIFEVSNLELFRTPRNLLVRAVKQICGLGLLFTHSERKSVMARCEWYV